MGEPTRSVTPENEQQPSALQTLIEAGSGMLQSMGDAVIAVKENPEGFVEGVKDGFVEAYEEVKEAVTNFFDGAPAEPVGGNQAYLDVVQALKELKPADMETLLKTSAPNPPVDVEGVVVQPEPPTQSAYEALTEPKQMRQTPEQLQITIEDLWRSPARR